MSQRLSHANQRLLDYSSKGLLSQSVYSYQVNSLPTGMERAADAAGIYIVRMKAALFM